MTYAPLSPYMIYNIGSSDDSVKCVTVTYLAKSPALDSVPFYSLKKRIPKVAILLPCPPPPPPPPLPSVPCSYTPTDACCVGVR